MPPVFRSRLFLGACIVLAVIVCYMPAMRAGFVWDDDLLVTENALVKGTDSLPYIWGSGASTDYTPLTITAFWVQWRVWGDNAAGYHLVNILLHALSALLLWRVLARLKTPGAWLGALLFAVHPVNVASVAWVAELKNSLSLPFYLGAIACWMRFLEMRKAGPYVLGLLGAACAFLSKGSTVILPIVLLLCTWWKGRRVKGADLLGLLPFFALAAIAAVVTIHFQERGIAAAASAAPVAERIARAGQAIWFYAGKDVWPFGLAIIYPKWPLDHQYLPLILAGALGVVLWLGRERWGRGPFFAWAYFIVALLPVLGMVNMTYLDQAYVADWWQQLALPGLTALIAAGIATMWARAHGAGCAAVSGLVAAIVLLLGAGTWNVASGYESMETLCRRALASNPDAWTAHDNLGNVLNTEGRLDEAVEQYQEALRLKPSDASTHSNLGTVYARLDRLDDAIAQYHAALALAPDNAKTWFNLGNALRAQGRNELALDAFSHAIDENARWVSPRYETGTILLESGRAAEAGWQAETIVHLDPEALSGHYLMARAAAAIGRFDVATAEAATALEIAKNAGDEKTIRQMQDALDACKAGRQPAAPEL
ncbi:MAG: tetratricopeptide repeat protein [Chthoniobacteraceae bacterium]